MDFAKNWSGTASESVRRLGSGSQRDLCKILRFLDILGFRSLSFIFGCSKCDFWNLGEIWDRNSKKIEIWKFWIFIDFFNEKFFGQKSKFFGSQKNFDQTFSDFFRRKKIPTKNFRITYSDAKWSQDSENHT